MSFVFSSTALEGKKIVVTGASRGIGRATFEALSRAGAFVIGTATSEKGLAEIQKAIDESGRPGACYLLNLMSRESTDAFVAAVEKDHGPIYALVNNAGVTRDMLAMRLKDEQWDEVIETNLTGAFRLTRGFMRGMIRERAGRIVNLSSVVGQIGNAGQANYAASKGALIAMSKSLARELGSRGITVNCVAPGFIETDMTNSLAQQQQDAMKAQIPLGRFGKPEDIANMVTYLASDAGSYITGQVLAVNGGMAM
jgi:3-oxoacyl-[acyl-carrier protein] reductase